MPTTTPAPQARDTTQMPFSFLSLVKEVRAPVKSGRSKTVDPLTLAKQKILAALTVQENLTQDVHASKPLPKKGDKTVRTWFTKHNEGWSSVIAYGQSPLQIGPGEKDTDMLIGTLPDVLNFYKAVRLAIELGEMDAVIIKAQEKKSKALRDGKSK